MRIVLVGPPGAGKGTQAVALSEALNIPRVSSGDLFRDHQRRNTPLGRLARTYMGRGVLVPDDVTIEMVMEWVNAPERAQGFLLDGFPRTVSQAMALDKELEPIGGIDRVLYINVSRNELVSRLEGRLVCRQCQAVYHSRLSPPQDQGKCDRCEGEVFQREDDAPAAVMKRLQVYAEETEPLVRRYRETCKLTEVDGEGSISEVRRRLLAAVE